MEDILHEDSAVATRKAYYHEYLFCTDLIIRPQHLQHSLLYVLNSLYCGHASNGLHLNRKLQHKHSVNYVNHSSVDHRKFTTVIKVLYRHSQVLLVNL